MKLGKIRIFALFFAVLGAGLWLTNCGGGGGGGTSSSTGSAGLFMTDDASSYQDIIAVVNSVTFLNSGNGDSCEVFPNASTSGPATVNLSNLSNVLALISTGNCPSESFNRVKVVFSNTVGLTNSAGTSSGCAFAGFSQGQPAPDTLSCSGNNCTMEVNGAVNVLANQNNRAALDFVLKDFNVTGFGQPNCSVTMRVSPLNASQMDQKGFVSGINGTISNAVDNTVTINTGTRSFLVNTTASGQTGFPGLMQFARANGLPAQANCTSFDFNAGSCQSSQVLASLTGTVSGLSNSGSTSTFTLTFKSGSITVSVPAAQVEGQLVNDKLAIVKLLSQTGNNSYAASQVESLAGMGAMGTPMNNGMPGGGMPMM